MKNRRAGVVALCFLISGALSIAATPDLVGPVPSAGPSLILKKNSANPQHLDMTWGDSCGLDQSDFAVYEGTLGGWYSHTSKLCSSGGALGASDVAPQPASSYYLVVALSPSYEGSYGTSGTGAEIPRGVATCRGAQSLEACSSYKRAFVSSISYPATFGGALGADVICQSLADGANRGGNWRAFVSDTTTTPAIRFTPAFVSYRRLDGAVIAQDWAGFTSGTHLNPINVDELGNGPIVAEVWTGTATNGSGSGGVRGLDVYQRRVPDGRAEQRVQRELDKRVPSVLRSDVPPLLRGAVEGAQRRAR